MDIKGKRVTLKPLNDSQYLYNLVDLNNGPKGEGEAKKVLETYENEFWEVYSGNSRLGVIGYLQVNGFYTLEGIKDPDAGLKGLVYSMEAAKLVLNYLSKFTDIVRTCARSKDKSIQILCDKLEFDKIMIRDNFIIYEKELKGN